MSDFIIDPQRGPHIRDYSDQSQDRVIIYSNTGYWAANGCGYTTREKAGVYTRDDAYKRAGHCGPEKGCCFYDVPADHVPTLQAKLSEAHQVIMAKCCPGPENWPDSKEWWQVAADRIDTLTGVLQAGKEDRWAATHGSDECGFEPTDWVIAAEKILAGEDHIPTLQAEVERLRGAIDRISIGGNHLASALIGILGASDADFPPYTTPIEDIHLHIDDPNYRDLWICWTVMMRERDELRKKEGEG